MSVTITRIKVAGDQTGNVAEVNTSNQLLVIDAADGSVTPGTVAGKSMLGGMQYNSTDPTLTNTQQVALQSTIAGRLKVDANVTGISGGIVSAFSDKVKVIVLTSSINIPSDSSYTTLYTYSGTGSLIGFNVEFNNIQIVVKLTIDGQIVFDGISISQFNSFVSTADSQSGRQAGNGIKSNSSSLDWSLKLPINYTSNVTISARIATGQPVNKLFQQGIIYIDKET